MATSKKFSQLPAASSISNNDLAAIAHEDALAETGYESQKATMIQIGKKILGDIEYVTDLPGFPSDEQNPFAALLYLRDSILDLLPVDEVSGAVANFKTDVVLPLIDVKAEIKAVETGTGVKSPSNPYVISGFTGANLYRSGANIWDEEWENGTISTSTGQNMNDSGKIRSKNYIKVKPNSKFRYVCTSIESGNDYLYYYDANKNFLSIQLIQHTTSIDYEFTTPNNCYYIRFIAKGSTYNDNIAINSPSTETAYSAYVGTNYPVSWQTEAGEVFGGEVDITNGKLKITHKGVKMSDLNWSKYDGGINTYRVNTVDKKIGDTNIICEIYNTFVSPFSNMANETIRGTDGTAYIYVRDDNYTTKEAFVGSLGNYIIVYELATPIEVDLTPQAITPILGVNNVWNDTNGDTTVDYKLGIQAYIDKKIAEVQALVL